MPLSYPSAALIKCTLKLAQFFVEEPEQGLYKESKFRPWSRLLACVSRLVLHNCQALYRLLNLCATASYLQTYLERHLLTCGNWMTVCCRYWYHWTWAEQEDRLFGQSNFWFDFDHRYAHQHECLGSYSSWEGAGALPVSLTCLS